MNIMEKNMDEAVAVKSFQVKLGISKVNAMRNAKSEKKRHALMGELFDMSDLPLPVKKHVITAGIIQGDIFLYGDGFAKIKDDQSTEENSNSARLCLEVSALSQKSYETSIAVVESLIDEILEPQKTSIKTLPANRSWKRVVKNEFDIQHLTRPVISHVITNGIIKGEIYQFSGAVVNTRGSPYMQGDKPLTGRPIYLLVQGPDEMAVYRAFDRIKQLIKEAEEIITNEKPQINPDESGKPGNKADHHQEQGPSKVKMTDQQPQLVVTEQKYFPPFMPQLGETPEADIDRFVILVQWLLAHPLLVSFMACPPKGLKSNRFGEKLALTVLQSLPLYDQYKCTHSKMISLHSESCIQCRIFFQEALRQVLLYCETVVSSGFDISKLMSVDDYIKELSVDPEQIGVLYDYPLPLNLFYIDNCRLFIDLVINCGLEIDKPQIESYLLSTNQWYPFQAFGKVVDYSPGIKGHNPTKNPKTHHYPLYRSIEHHGGLINFHLETIGNAGTGQLFLADADKIPKCKYFPFLHRLSVFSKLYNINVNKKYNATETQTSSVSGSISQAAYRLAKESLNNPRLYTSASSPYDTMGASASHQQIQPNVVPRFSMPLSQVPPQPPYLSSQPSTSSHQSSVNNPLPTEKSASRKLRKEVRKVYRKEEHGLSENTQPQASAIPGSLFSQNVQEVLSNMQHSMQTNLFKTPATPMSQERNPILEPALFNAGQMFVEQHSKEDNSKFHCESSQENPFSEVISKLQEYIQGTSTKAEEVSPIASTSATPPQSTATASIDQESPFTAVIQQLQQYIHSNIESTPKDDMENRKPSGDEVKKPVKMTSRFDQPPSSSSVKPESCLLKRASTKYESESQPKRLCTEQKTNSTQEKLVSVQQNPVYQQRTTYVQQKPGPVQQKPAPVQQKPVFTQQRPMTAQQRPGFEQLKPAPVQHKPVTAQQRPGFDKQKPSPVQQKPVAAQQRPGFEQQKPSPVQQKPVAAQQRPGFEQQKPSPVQQKPVAAQQRPMTAQQRPGLEQQKPSPVQQRPMTAQQRPGFEQHKPAYAGPSSSIQQHPIDKSKFFSSVSILGDSLLRRARVVWGGSSDRDLIKDAHTLVSLHKDLNKYIQTGGKLNPYCVMMCGLNDIMNNVSHKKLVKRFHNMIQCLNANGYYVFLVTLPNIDKLKTCIPAVNGYITSFRIKANVTVIPFHESETYSLQYLQKFEQGKGVQNTLLRAVQFNTGSGKRDSFELTDLSCKLVQELIEKEI